MRSLHIMYQYIVWRDFWYGRKEGSDAQPPSGTAKPGMITGVTEMKSFDEENILMETSQGTLEIRGSSLHVCRLELDKGEAEIEGKVDSLIYTQGKNGEKKGSLLKRLFQ